MNKVAITTSSFGKKALGLLENKGVEVLLNPYGRKLVKEEIIGICKDAIGIIAGTETLDKATIEQLKNLRVISRCGAGLDSVDLGAAEKLGIRVFNTPDAPTTAVAELTVALMLNLLRKVNTMDSNLKGGVWEKLMGNLMYGKKIGMVGFGRIGRKVAELLRPFGCVIRYADPFLENGIMGLERLPLEKLLSWADIISIHVSTHVSTQKEIIGQREMQLMKKGALLLNTSRGGVVNEDALCQVINSKYLSGAALDVFEQEPYNGPLKEFSNCILTPHIGSYAIESRTEMEIQAVENLFKGLDSLERRKI